MRQRHSAGVGKAPLFLNYSTLPVIFHPCAIIRCLSGVTTDASLTLSPCMRLLFSFVVGEDCSNCAGGINPEACTGCGEKPAHGNPHPTVCSISACSARAYHIIHIMATYCSSLLACLPYVGGGGAVQHAQIAQVQLVCSGKHRPAMSWIIHLLLLAGCAECGHPALSDLRGRPAASLCKQCQAQWPGMCSWEPCLKAKLLSEPPVHQ